MAKKKSDTAPAGGHPDSPRSTGGGHDVDDEATAAPGGGKGARKAASTAEALFGNPFAGTLKDSAQQIWQAGLGAFAKAQAEGSKVFDALVKEGAHLQRQNRGKAAEEAPAKAEAPPRSGQPWDRLESIFEERTAQALGRLGIPTARDLEALARRIDVLSLEVARLSHGAGSSARVEPAAAAKKTAARGKTAPKPAPATRAAPSKKKPRADGPPR